MLGARNIRNPRLDSKHGGNNLELGAGLPANLELYRGCELADLANLELYRGLEFVEQLALSLEGSQLHVNCIDHQLRKVQ